MAGNVNIQHYQAKIFYGGMDEIVAFNKKAFWLSRFGARTQPNYPLIVKTVRRIANSNKNKNII